MADTANATRTSGGETPGSKTVPKWLKYSTLALLYFVQGAPYGFQSACLPVVLRQAGVSFTRLGAMKLLFLPWVCKALYAPLMEKKASGLSPKFWLTLSLMGLAASCFLGGSPLCDPENWGTSSQSAAPMEVLFLVLLTQNFFSATQDIVVDGLAVGILQTPEEMAVGNTIQVVAYKVGSVFAGGVLLYLKVLLGWSGMFYAFASIYVISVILVFRLNLIERSSPDQSAADFSQPSGRKPGQKSSPKGILGHLLYSLRDVVGVKGTLCMMAYLMVYKLCERAEQTLTTHLVDRRVSSDTLAFWSTVVRTFSVAGSAYGGYAISRGRSTPRNLIFSCSVLRALSVAAQLAVVFMWAEIPPVSVEDGKIVWPWWHWAFVQICFLLQCAALFSAGAITTAVFTAMMQLSKKAPEHIRASHFSTLSAAEVLGKVCFAAISGYWIDVWGFLPMYSSFAGLAFLSIPAIALMPFDAL